MTAEKSSLVRTGDHRAVTRSGSKVVWIPVSDSLRERETTLFRRLIRKGRELNVHPCCSWTGKAPLPASGKSLQTVAAPGHIHREQGNFPHFASCIGENRNCRSGCRPFLWRSVFRRRKGSGGFDFLSEKGGDPVRERGKCLYFFGRTTRAIPMTTEKSTPAQAQTIHVRSQRPVRKLTNR